MGVELLPLFMFLTLVALFFTGYPIALILGGVALLFGGIGLALGEFRFVHFFNLVPRVWGGVAENFVLVSVPMFILMGTVLEKSGIGDDLLRCLQVLLRRIPGGLALSVTTLGVVMAATTGIIGASVVMLTLLALPSMLAQRYSVSLATGTIASAGTLGILIPPSIMLVFMADMLSISVILLFLAAVIPGLMLAGLYVGYIVTVSAIRPDMAPALAAAEGPKTAAGLVLMVLRSFLPPVLLIVLVLGSIFGGFVTVTESAGIGAAGALVLAVLNRRLSWPVFHEILDRTTRINAMIFLILFGAMAFSYVFRQLGGDALVVEAMRGMGVGSWGILITVMVTIFILGFFFDWIEITLIVIPVIAPVLALLDFGDHIARPEILLWFGILVAVNLQTSFLTPPLGFAILYVKGAAPSGLRLEDLYRGVVPFVLLQLIGLGLIMTFPSIALWLPSLWSAR